LFASIRVMPPSESQHAPFDCAHQGSAANKPRQSIFGDDLYLYQQHQSIDVIISSFSFKTGPPCAANLVVDVRFLPDPRGLEDHYSSINGQHPAVGEFIRASSEFEPFFEELTKSTMRLVDGCSTNDCPRILIAVGCTAGRHRSVFVAESLAAHVRGTTDIMTHNVRVFHRDSTCGGQLAGKMYFDGLDCRPCDEIMKSRNEDSDISFEMDVDVQCVSSSSSADYVRADEDGYMSGPLSSSSSAALLDDMSSGVSSIDSSASGPQMQFHYCPDTQKLEVCDRQLSKSCSTVLGSVLGNGLNKLKRLRERRSGSEGPSAEFQPTSY
jgi:hypothetical protein